MLRKNYIGKMRRKNKGSVFILTIMFVGIISIILVPFIAGKVNTHYRISFRKIALKEALYIANGGINFGLAYVANHSPVLSEGENEIEFTDLSDLPGLQSVKIERTAQESVYKIISVANLRGVQKTIETIVFKNPPAKVFDYVYFLNNWGWWFGNSIFGFGDVRSNGFFDFKYNPYLDGHVFARFSINTHGGQLRGPGGRPENQHAGADYLFMPNLYHIDYYIALAQSKDGTLTKGSNTIIDNVYNGNLYIEAYDKNNPLIIDGPVVVNGDLILGDSYHSGADMSESKRKRIYIKGQGTIYANGNIYVGTNVEYVDGPNTPRPNTNSLEAKRNWVDANRDKTLVGLAARESIFFGNVNNWPSIVMQYLGTMGDESRLGADGIPGTSDDNIPYDHDYDPSTPPTTWFDVDGDGVVDTYYNYNDIRLTNDELRSFNNYPHINGQPKSYDNVATSRINKFEFLAYTNHAFAGYSSVGPFNFNGAVISKDEAIIYTRQIKLNYDERLHSRFNNDPNRFIDLGLPVAEKTRIISWYEK